VDVPQAALASTSNDRGLAIVREVRHSAMLISYDGAKGNVDHEILAAFAVLPCSTTAFTTIGLEARLMCERRQRIETTITAKQHVAASPAIAPVRTATGNVLFTAEANDAVSAVASFDHDLSAVDQDSIWHSSLGYGKLTFMVHTHSRTKSVKGRRGNREHRSVEKTGVAHD
jgi:hypothetical protein